MMIIHEEEYPTFYNETETKPGFAVGDIVKADVEIKSITESKSKDGKSIWEYEACVKSVGGKDQKEVESPEEGDDMEEIEEGLEKTEKGDTEYEK